VLDHKEPVAHQASARRAEVDETRLGPTPFVQPLLSSIEEMNPIGLGFECLATIASRSDQNTRSIRPGRGEDEGNFETTGSRKENGVRVSRKKSPISVAAVRRILDAASKAGFTVAHVEVQPDGTIRLSAGGSPEPVSQTADDIFSAWESRL
jgi:hypothetical protein